MLDTVWSHKDDGDIHRLIEDAFLAATDEVLLSLLNENGDERIDAKREARKLVLEWCVTEWVRAQSLKEADPTEPTTHDMLDQLECIRMAMPENERPLAWGVASDVSARKKASRLRGKWSGRVGKFKTRPQVSPGEMRNKAAAACQWYRNGNQLEICLGVQAFWT